MPRLKKTDPNYIAPENLVYMVVEEDTYDCYIYDDLNILAEDYNVTPGQLKRWLGTIVPNWFLDQNHLAGIIKRDARYL